ncbi:hypothetical protein [Nocardia asteroides]|uniref:hypothetical protein n=1 Tax=Nocardia asteroides TaxID=1824 RepID=UPI00344013FC
MGNSGPEDDARGTIQIAAVATLFVVVVVTAWFWTRPSAGPGVELSECGDRKCTVIFDRHVSNAEANVINQHYRLIEVVGDVVTLDAEATGGLLHSTRRVGLGETDRYQGRMVTVLELTDDHVVLLIEDELLSGR